MSHAAPLIETIVGGIVVAFLLGAIAQRLRLPVLIGYLLAGVLVGPFTPGYVADQAIANELAELGIILLMFGVGLHFSIKDLLAVRRIAVPGAIVQVAVAVAMGWGLGNLMGWSLGGGLLFGLALSVASTVVLLRAMQERGLIETEKGRIAVGWLIVEDLAMVLALVIIPAVAGGAANGGMATTLALTLGKVAAFVVLMLVVGSRVVPWLLRRVAQSGSRELFRLAVLAIALGIALGAAMLFGVSFALGAFFAGVILAESPFSHRAAEETLPLRDAFAVLFFVSVGMLFNPRILVEAPLALLGTIAIIVIGKSVAAYLIVRMFGRSNAVALTIAASLAQIGEFSFILATLGGKLGLLPAVGRDLILAGAIFSIMLNPALFALLDRLTAKEAGGDADDGDAPAGHFVVIGHGRVGSRVAAGLIADGDQVTIVEMDPDRDALPRDSNARVIGGNATNVATFAKAELQHARMLFLAIPAGYEAAELARRARAARPDLPIVARVHSDEESAQMTAAGATVAVMGESEIARRMVEYARDGGESP